MSFGERFVNLLEDPRLTTLPPFDLGRRIAAALALIPSGPCTFYVGKPASLNGADAGHVEAVSSWVSWEFGPRSLVALAPGTVWRLEGSVQLGVHHRFVCLRDARVELSGPLSSIRPEWWGSGNPVASMRAAIALAQYRARVGAPRVPIALRGPYELADTVRVETHARGVGFEIEFVGRHPRGDEALAPTLQRATSADTSRPLISLADGVRATFSHVAFDLRYGPNAAVSTRGAVVHEGFSNGCTFRRCTFLFDRGDAVALSLAENDADGLIVENPTGRAVFEECWFEGSGRDTSGAAVRVAERGMPRVRFDGCSFRGAANAMVAVPGGMVEIVGCDFHNEARGELRQGVVTDLGGDRERGFPRAAFSPGVDVVVGRAARSTDEHIVQAAWERAKGLPGNPPPLGLSVVHVQSRSGRFLVGERHAAQGDSFVAITGLVSRPQEELAVSVPSIFWRGATGGGVLIQGSDILGFVDSGVEPVLASASRLRRGAGGASQRWSLVRR